MTNPFVDKAKSNMGAIERLLKGLPVIRGYVDKELRRDADYRLRQTIAGGLDQEKQRLYKLQQTLAGKGGLIYIDDVDRAVQKLQTLSDRIRTASYGYAGLLDAVKIREEQLDALHRFDVALAARTYEIQEAIDAIEKSLDEGNSIDEPLSSLTDKLDELNRLYEQRYQAVVDPELLHADQVPDVEEDWMTAAEHYGTDSEPDGSAKSNP